MVTNVISEHQRIIVEAFLLGLRIEVFVIRNYHRVYLFNSLVGYLKECPESLRIAPNHISRAPILYGHGQMIKGTVTFDISKKPDDNLFIALSDGCIIGGNVEQLQAWRNT